jgi:putative hemolysin
MTLPATGASRLSLRIAATADEIRAAQRLRYEVFAAELGATLHTPFAGLDVDEVDQHADHLIVVDESADVVVGTYRMLPPDRAGQLGRLYSDGEFHLDGVGDLRDRLVETGRSCVAPAYRSGAVINMMWAGIARYLHLTGHRWLVGCASVPLSDGGSTAAYVWQTAVAKHLAPDHLQVRPIRPWPAAAVMPGAGSSIPPLLRGYLRLGAWVCGPPAFDPDFDVADFLILLSLDRIHSRYLAHFLGDSG